MTWQSFIQSVQRLWNRIVETYEAQQEVIKRQSEVSHVVTWLLWRKSPRIGTAEWVIESGEYIEGYNFAEIVTIIAYILCQLQIVSIFALVLFHRLPFDHIQGLTMIVSRLALFAILLVDFKQLFQRDWWPTVWRTLIIVLFA